MNKVTFFKTASLFFFLLTAQFSYGQQCSDYPDYSPSASYFEALFNEYKISNKHLDTLFAGTKTNTKTSVFKTKRFDDFISFLKEKYDYIIFDSAPILFMVESLELLEKSDFVVHVFRKNFSSKKLVNYVLDYKEKYNKKNIGYVITDDTKPDKFIDKYGYAYGYGYGYGYGAR